MHLDKIHSHTAAKLNDNQKSVLKESFAKEPYPSKDTRQKLSEKLGLKVKTVYNWFKDERGRILKENPQLIQKRMYLCVCTVCECLSHLQTWPNTWLGANKLEV